MDDFALERLAQYILRCPFSLARVVRVTDDGSVVYRAEKDRCRRFPKPTSRDLISGPRRNFQVFEVDPLECPKCGSRMKIISFIERIQQEVIERILRHCGLWEGPIRTLANARGPPSDSERAPDEPRELQLVLDPEFL